MYFITISLTSIIKSINIFQTWLFARDYCCSIGMYLASFSTMALMQDAHKLFAHPYGYIVIKCYPTLYKCNMILGGGQMWLDESYANGDGTDSWCSTNEKVELKMYSGQSYVSPKCDIWSCVGLSEFEAGGSPQLYTREGSLCTDGISSDSQMHFLCV